MPGGVVEQPPVLREQVRRGGQGALLAAAGLVALILIGFLAALEDQLGRLHAPDERKFPFDAVHGDHVTEAFAGWDRGREALHEFLPVDPVVLIRVHVGVDIVFAVALAAFLLLLLRRLRLSQWWAPVVVLGAAADLVESMLELAVAFGPHDGRYATPFGVLKIVKFGAPGLTALRILCRLWGRIPQGWRAYRTSPATARLVFVAAAGFAVLLHAGDIGAQAEDLLRRELEHWVGLFRLGAALAVYLLVIAMIRRIVVPGGTPARAQAIFRNGVLVLIAGAVVLVLHGGSGPLVLGVILTAFGLGSLAFGAPDWGAPEGSGLWLYVLAGILPPASLAVLAGRLLAAEVATHGRWPPLVAVELVLLATAVVAGWRLQLRPVGSAAGGRQKACLIAVAAVPPLVAIGQFAFQETSNQLGSALSALGVFLIALAGFAAVGGLVRLWLAGRDPPGVEVRRRKRRAPVVALLVVWFFGTALGGARLEDAASSPHNVRLLTDPGRPSACPAGPVRAALFRDPPPADAEVAEAFCLWIERNARATSVAAPPSGGAVPLVLVSASGGGVRAAAWTARVLDCFLFPAPAPRRPAGPADGAPPDDDPCGPGRVAAADGTGSWPLLFAGGGASGGSVGLVSAAAQRLAPMTGGREWIRQLAQPDHVGPLLAHTVLAELSLAPAGLLPAYDRAELLIDGWAKPFGRIGARCRPLQGRPVTGAGFLALHRHCPDEVPLLLLNGTVVRTGERFNIAPLDRTGGPGGRSVDLQDVLCPDQDVPLFDAAFLSARFPLATPSGRFLADPGCGRHIRSGVDVVDGGYVENSGTAQILQVWPMLQELLERYGEDVPPGYRDVQEILLRIENGEVADKPSRRFLARGLGWPVTAFEPDGTLRSRVGEPLRVPETYWNVQIRGAETETATRELLDTLKMEDVPVLHLALHRHPGRRLPLGWALTDGILDDVDRTFRLCPNLLAAAAFRALIEGGPPDDVPGCLRPGGPGVGPAQGVSLGSTRVAGQDGST